LSGLRGLWFGFHQEFYHGKKKVNDKCLSNDADDEIYDLLYFIEFGELQDLFNVADDLYTLYTDCTQMCDIKEVSTAVMTLCSES
jgi:hypothetical protein